MASGFPGSIDNFTDPLTTSALNSPSHAGQHQDLNDAVEKIETYMGLVKVIPTSVSSAGGTSATLSATGTVTIGSSNTTVTVNGCFSSLYDNYRIIYSNITPSVSQDLYFRLASGGTSATTNYTFGFSYVSTATGAVSGVGNALTSYQITGSVQSASFRHLGSIDVFQPFLTQFTSIVSTGYITRADIVSSGVNGNHQTASSYDGFTLYPSTGNISGGTIRVYGYRN